MEDGWRKHLDAIVAQTFTTHRIPADRVVVGGFSAGGAAAVRYAEFCAAHRSPARVRSRGVFAVDAPLDFGRFWRGETLAVRRGAHPRFVGEVKDVLADMRRVLGESPDDEPAPPRDVAVLGVCRGGRPGPAACGRAGVSLYRGGRPVVDGEAQGGLL